MFEEHLIIAFNEFVHVAIVLVILIGVISVLTGIMREYVPQEKIQKRLGSGLGEDRDGHRGTPLSTHFLL